MHVSQLKKHVPPNTEVLDDLSTVATDPSFAVLPIQVIDRKTIQLGGRQNDRVKVQWEHHPPSMASWENWEDLTRRFPMTWGQVVAKVGGVRSSTDSG